MTLRIALFGAESTGKSTLARQLAAHFDAPCVLEYVRAFWDEHDGRIDADDLGTIARGQLANEKQAARAAPEFLFCDTELITNTLWADLLFPQQCPDWVREAANRRSRHYALYLLCDTDLPFVADVQRCFPQPEERASCRRLWRAALVERGLPFVDIHGPYEQRLATAIDAIEKLQRDDGLATAWIQTANKLARQTQS